MSFSPLGHFNVNAPVDLALLAKARALMKQLPNVPAHGLDRCYLHWSVSGMGCDFTDYNVEAKIESNVWTLKVEHNPQDEVTGLNNDAEIAGTWHRNTGSVAIAITGMDGASEADFGPFGVTVTGLTHLCAGAAALCAKYDIDTLGRVPSPGSNHADNNGHTVNTGGELNILTHAEVAILDAYPSERWDLGLFAPLPAGLSLTSAMRSQCGDALRTVIHKYKGALA